MSRLAESHVEAAALDWLEGLGYEVLYGPDISPDGPNPERASYGNVLLMGRFREALRKLNPHLPAETLEDVFRKVQQTEKPSLVEENRRLHRILVEGLDVEITREDGSIDLAHRLRQPGQQRLAGPEPVHRHRAPEQPLNRRGAVHQWPAAWRA